jgi:hypothetical protein
VFFLFSERIHSESESSGARNCGVCGKSQPFSHVIETKFFCLFGLRLLPVEKIANYLRCDQCNNSFSREFVVEPTQVALVKRVLVYLQLGYALQEQREVIQDICIKVTGFELRNDEINREVEDLDSAKVEIFQSLRSCATGLNLQGKQQIIEAAFLITHACCEIQYEDRLRINLIGSALGVSIEFVSSVIDHAHSHGCYGVRRFLPSAQRLPDS